MALSIPGSDPDPLLLFCSHLVRAGDGWSSWMLGNYSWELGSPRRYELPAALLLPRLLVCLNYSSIIDCRVNRSWCKYKNKHGTIVLVSPWLHFSLGVRYLQLFSVYEVVDSCISSAPACVHLSRSLSTIYHAMHPNAACIHHFLWTQCLISKLSLFVNVTFTG